MFIDVVRRVVDPVVADRMEQRFLEGHPELGLHWVDVRGRGVQAACGLFVDSFSQWERNDRGRVLHVCGECTVRMPDRLDQPVE